MDALLKAVRGVLLHTAIEVAPDENGSHLATGFVRVRLEDIIDLCEAVDAMRRLPGMRVDPDSGELVYSAAYL